MFSYLIIPQNDAKVNKTVSRGKGEGLMPRFNGKKYRELMDKQGLTERKVAEHIGYTAPLVHYIIAGTRSPNFEQAVGMADLVGCSVDELIIRET